MDTVKSQECWGSTRNNTPTKQKSWSFCKVKNADATLCYSSEKDFCVGFANTLSSLAGHVCQLIAYTKLAAIPIFHHLFQPGQPRPAKPFPWGDSESPFWSPSPHAALSLLLGSSKIAEQMISKYVIEVSSTEAVYLIRSAMISGKAEELSELPVLSLDH